jgi:hypothetical protein
MALPVLLVTPSNLISVLHGKDINLVRMTGFCNNVHQVRSKSKDWKDKSAKSFWEQENQGPKQYSRIRKK